MSITLPPHPFDHNRAIEQYTKSIFPLIFRRESFNEPDPNRLKPHFTAKTEYLECEKIQKYRIQILRTSLVPCTPASYVVEHHSVPPSKSNMNKDSLRLQSAVFDSLTTVTFFKTIASNHGLYPTHVKMAYRAYIQSEPQS